MQVPTKGSLGRDPLQIAGMERLLLALTTRAQAEGEPGYPGGRGAWIPSRQTKGVDMLQTDVARTTLPAGRDGPAIEARGLVMRYGDQEVLHGIDLVVQQGMVLGFLGPNGAGKTTTIEILEGYRRRPRPLDEVIGLVELQEAADRRVRALSGGQRRRLDVALALVGDPELVFLDEPTTGFDPAARRQAWRMIGGLRDLGKTILLTTHYMDEAQELADRVAIIQAGRIVAEGTPADLAAAQRVTEIRFTLPADAEPGDLPRVSGAVLSGGREVEVSTKDPTGDLLALTSWAAGRGVGLDGLTVARPSLEDIYLALTSDKEATA